MCMSVWHILTLFTPSPCPLQVAAKQAAAAATQTIAASQNAAVSNKNPAAQQQLVQSCKVSSGRQSQSARDNPDRIRIPCARVIRLRQIIQAPNPVCSRSHVPSVHTHTRTYVCFLCVKWMACVEEEYDALSFSLSR